MHPWSYTCCMSCVESVFFEKLCPSKNCHCFLERFIIIVLWLVDRTLHFSILFALHLSWFREGTERRGCSWGCSESSTSRFVGRKLCKNSTNIYSIRNNGGSTKTSTSTRSTCSTKTGTSTRSTCSTKSGRSTSSTSASSTRSTKTGTSGTSNTGNKPSINITSRTTSYTTSVCAIASISSTDAATPQPSCCSSSCSCRWRRPTGGKGWVWAFCNFSFRFLKEIFKKPVILLFAELEWEVLEEGFCCPQVLYY